MVKKMRPSTEGVKGLLGQVITRGCLGSICRHAELSMMNRMVHSLRNRCVDAPLGRKGEGIHREWLRLL